MGELYCGVTLYVGDLHPDVTELALAQIFSTAISIRICKDVISKRSLGYAYVNFRQPIDAQLALDNMNFKPICGRPMRIMWSMRDPSLRRSGIGNVFIKNLNEGITPKVVYDYFSDYGTILSCKVATNETGPNGYGFVHFETHKAARNAIRELHGKESDISKKLYVGNFLSRRERFTNVYVKNFRDKLDDGKLRLLFQKFGAITSAKVMTDETGASKGFGFVNFKNVRSAQEAVSNMNGKEVFGLRLYAGFFVKKAVRRAELKKKFSKGGNLYVKNLADDVDDEVLYTTFSEFGTITSAKVMMESGRSKGFGFVCFSTHDSAEMALEGMKGKSLHSKPMYISWAERKEERRKQLTAMFKEKMSCLHKIPPSPVTAYNVATPTHNQMYSQQLMCRPETHQFLRTATYPQHSTDQHIDATPQIPAGVQTIVNNHNPQLISTRTNVQRGATPQTTTNRPPPTNSTDQHIDATPQIPAGVQTIVNNHNPQLISTRTNVQRGATPQTTTNRPPPTNITQNSTRSNLKYNQRKPATFRAGMFQPSDGKSQLLDVIAKRTDTFVSEDQGEMIRDCLVQRIRQCYPGCDDRIIGMLSEQEPAELMAMLHSETLLRNRVKEASEAYDNHAAANPRDVTHSKKEWR